MRRPSSVPFAAIALGLAAGLLPCVPAVADTQLATTGRRHVDFTLPEISTGKPVSLSDFRGKRVLLIHFASW